MPRKNPGDAFILSPRAFRHLERLLGLSAWAAHAEDEADPHAMATAMRYIRREAKRRSVSQDDLDLDRLFWAGEFMPGPDLSYTAKELMYLAELESYLFPTMTPPLLERTP